MEWKGGRKLRMTGDDEWIERLQTWQIRSLVALYLGVPHEHPHPRHTIIKGHDTLDRSQN